MAKNKVEGWGLVVGKVEDAIFDALGEIGMHSQANLRARLSVPVEYTEDGETIRSLPGEAPRTEEGRLVEGIQYEPYYTDDGPQLDITIERQPGPGDDPDAARILDEGGVGNWGEIEPRPFSDHEAAQIREEAPAILVRHIIHALKQ